MMPEDFEQIFYDIAQETISKAMKVKCDIPTYIDGLQGMIDDFVPPCYSTSSFDQVWYFVSG